MTYEEYVRLFDEIADEAYRTHEDGNSYTWYGYNLADLAEKRVESDDDEEVGKFYNQHTIDEVLGTGNVVALHYECNSETITAVCESATEAEVVKNLRLCMAVGYVEIGVDAEYNAEEWWEAARKQCFPPQAILPLLKVGGTEEIVIVSPQDAEEIQEWAEALPGWHGAEQCPLIFNPDDATAAEWLYLEQLEREKEND